PALWRKELCRYGSEVEQRKIIPRGRRFDRQEISVDVGECLVAQKLLPVGWHIETRRTRLEREGCIRKHTRSDFRARAPVGAMSKGTVAGRAHILYKGLLAAVGGTRWRGVLRERSRCG